MDALSDILTAIRFRSSVYFLKEFRAPWGMRVAPSEHARFHMICRGTCWLGTEGSGPVQLSPGEVIIFPHGKGHWLADDPTSSRREGYDGEIFESETCVSDAAPSSTTLVCGHFEFDRRGARMFFASLPPMIHLKMSEHPDLVWFEPALIAALRQGHGSPGGTALAVRLTEVLFLYALRDFVQKKNTGGDFFAALSDEVVGRALNCLHDNPARDWDLPGLARSVGTSRTALASKFRALVGESPMQYLREWRMQKAAALLRDSTLSIAEIAQAVGYHSEPSFHRAFKSVTNQNPGKIRRQR